MAEKIEKKTAGAKLNGFLEKNRKVLLIVLCVIVLALVGYIVGYSIGTKQNAKDLSAIDQISFELTDKSSSLEESEIETRRNAAIEKLEAYNKKSGVVGVRANMLSADLLFQQKKYDDAAVCYEKAASLKKNAYTSPLNKYNAGVCYEQTNNLDKAAEAYKAAADNKEFVLAAHAKFSYGRVLEAQKNYAEAVKAYTELNDSNPDDTWANLAKTRIIALETEGKVE